MTSPNEFFVTTTGGRCVLGGATCTKRGDSCNTNPPNPGGAFCCLDQGEAVVDASVDADAAPDAPAVFTPDRDQTCNDDLAISSIHGTCRQAAAEPGVLERNRFGP